MTQSSKTFYLLMPFIAIVSVTTSLPATATALSLADVMQQTVAEARHHERPQQRSYRSDPLPLPVPCPMPTDPRVMVGDLDSDAKDTVTLLRPALRGSAVLMPRSYRDNRPPLSLLEEGESTNCTKDQGRGLRGFRHDSVCPYYMIQRHLPTGYIPAMYQEAVCKCTDCRTNLAMMCQPVSANISLLRPDGCWNGMQRYQQFHMHVPVACACVAAAAAPDLGQEAW